MDGDSEEQKEDWLNNMVLFVPRTSNAIGEKVENKSPTASAPTVEPAARSEPAAASVSEPLPQAPETSALVPAPAASAPVPVPAASAASAPVPAPAASKSATKRGLQQQTGQTRGSRSKSVASPSVSLPEPVYTFHGRSDAVGPAAAAPTTDPVITLVAPTTPPEVIAPEGGSCTVDEYKYNANDLDRFCKTTRQAAIEVCNELQNNDITPGDKGTQPEPATGAGDRAKHLAGVMLLMRTIVVASAASAPMGAGAASQGINWSSHSARSLPDGFHFEQPLFGKGELHLRVSSAGRTCFSLGFECVSHQDGAKLVEAVGRQCFSKDISYVVLRRHEWNRELHLLDHVSHVEVATFD